MTLPEDGTISRYEASVLTVVTNGVPRPVRVGGVSGVRATVEVTDCRVAVACSKYEKGSWWFGFGLIGLPLAVLLTAISKLMAAERRRGKMLVGHVRYDWLAAVDATRPGGLMAAKIVSLHLANPAGEGGLTLLIALRGQQEAAAVAADIASRAARYRAASSDDDATRQEALLRYAVEPTFETFDNGTRRYGLPLPVESARR